MADYIDRSILLQAYVHIDTDVDVDSPELAKIRTRLNGYIGDRAKHFLYEEISTDTEFKSGSLRVYATVLGSLTKALGKYQNFYGSLTNLAWFSRRLSDAAVMEAAFYSHSFLEGIHRTEARPGIIGLTKKVVDGLRASARPRGSSEIESACSRLKFTADDIIRLSQALYYSEDRELLSTEVGVYVKLLPTQLPRTVEESLRALYLRRVKDVETAYSELVSADLI